MSDLFNVFRGIAETCLFTPLGSEFIHVVCSIDCTLVTLEWLSASHSICILSVYSKTCLIKYNTMGIPPKCSSYSGVQYTEFKTPLCKNEVYMEKGNAHNIRSYGYIQ